MFIFTWDGKEKTYQLSLLSWKLLYCQGEWYIEKNEYIYIYSAPVSGANGYIQKNTVSYKQLTKEFTRNWGGSEYGIAKQSKISSNINQLIESTLKVFNCQVIIAMNQSIW